jgi:amphi-Trp domain-containing protein
MADVEITRKTRLTREEAGERLIALGKSLAAGPKSTVGFDGDSIRFAVADHVEWEFQLEVDGDEVELEIELTWSDAAPAGKPAPAAAEPVEPAPAEEPPVARAEPPAAAAPARRRTKGSRASASG